MDGHCNAARHDPPFSGFPGRDAHKQQLAFLLGKVSGAATRDYRENLKMLAVVGDVFLRTNRCRCI